ncbi:MAG TPA: ABC transporter permease [Mycobacteriales bacterium]
MPRLGTRPSLAAATGAVYAGQIARARTARVPLLFVAAFQSIGILLLLRGVVAHHDDLTGRVVVAGTTVLVAAFVCLNLLAQRVGVLRAEGGLDHYAALDVPGAAVALGAAASYATLMIPGAVITAFVGASLFDLPYGRLWILAPVLPLVGAALAGVGTLIGLLAPKHELATVAGQLGMSAVLFLGIIPEHRFPLVLQWVRDAVPSTYAVDALADTFATHVDWTGVGVDLVVCLAVAVVTLGLAGAVFRRSVR